MFSNILQCNPYVVWFQLLFNNIFWKCKFQTELNTCWPKYIRSKILISNLYSNGFVVKYIVSRIISIYLNIYDRNNFYDNLRIPSTFEIGYYEVAI